MHVNVDRRNDQIDMNLKWGKLPVEIRAAFIGAFAALVVALLSIFILPITSGTYGEWFRLRTKRNHMNKKERKNF